MWPICPLSMRERSGCRIRRKSCPMRLNWWKGGRWPAISAFFSQIPKGWSGLDGWLMSTVGAGTLCRLSAQTHARRALFYSVFAVTPLSGGKCNLVYRIDELRQSGRRSRGCSFRIGFAQDQPIVSFPAAGAPAVGPGGGTPSPLGSDGHRLPAIHPPPWIDLRNGPIRAKSRFTKLKFQYLLKSMEEEPSQKHPCAKPGRNLSQSGEPSEVAGASIAPWHRSMPCS